MSGPHVVGLEEPDYQRGSEEQSREAGLHRAWRRVAGEQSETERRGYLGDCPGGKRPRRSVGSRDRSPTWGARPTTQAC